MKKFPSENILGYQVAAADTEECLNLVVSWLESNDQRRFFACANPHSLMIAAKDMTFRDALHCTDLLTPDGVGILIGSKILGGRIAKRVTGSDIFFGLSRRLNGAGPGRYSYFFLGSSDEILAQIQDKLAEDFPAIRFAGSFSPPYKPEFSDDDNALMIEAINAAQPDVLWVGMTAPKQEKWIFQNRDKLDAKFIGAIGAVFDFYTGRVKRSHTIFQKLGLEWLPRLLQDPRRLWRRMVISAPIFLWHVLKAKIRGD